MDATLFLVDRLTLISSRILRELPSVPRDSATLQSVFYNSEPLYGSELLGGKSGKFFYGKNGRQEDCWRETEDKNPERRRRGRKTENHVLLGMLVRFCLYGSIQIIRVRILVLCGSQLFSKWRLIVSARVTDDLMFLSYYHCTTGIFSESEDLLSPICVTAVEEYFSLWISLLLLRLRSLLMD